jgi:rubrerythrin
MPDFVDPFLGNVPQRTMNRQELIRAIRLNLAAEQEAVYLYTAHADATDHPLARKILLDIADEEREHIGEFEELLEILTGTEYAKIAEGQEEVREMAAGMAAGEQAGTETPRGGSEETTIGGLKQDQRNERSS